MTTELLAILYIPLPIIIFCTIGIISCNRTSKTLNKLEKSLNNFQESFNNAERDRKTTEYIIKKNKHESIV